MFVAGAGVDCGVDALAPKIPVELAAAPTGRLGFATEVFDAANMCSKLNSIGDLFDFVFNLNILLYWLIMH